MRIIKSVAKSVISEDQAPKLKELKLRFKKRQKSVIKLDAGSISWLRKFDALERVVFKSGDASFRILEAISNADIVSKPLKKSSDKEFISAANELVDVANNLYDKAISYITKGSSEFDMVMVFMVETRLILTLACYLFTGNTKKAKYLYDKIYTRVRDAIPPNIQDLMDVIDFPLVTIVNPSKKMQTSINSIFKKLFPNGGDTEGYYPSSGDLIHDYGFSPKDLIKVDNSIVLIADTTDTRSSKLFVKELQVVFKDFTVKLLTLNGDDIIVFTK